MQLQFLSADDCRRASRSHMRRACAWCRQRKKRCYHNKASQSPKQPPQVESSSPREGHASPGFISQPDTEQEHPGPSTTSNQNTDPNPFLCDTSPIVTLLSDPRSRLRKGQSQKGIVGASLHHTRFPPESTTESLYPSPRFFSTARPQDTEAGNIGILPPKSCQEALVDIYFRRLHSFLPLLDEDETRSQFANGTLSLPLLQSMCLAASKSGDAAPFLCLGTDIAPLPVEAFGQRIYADVPNNMPKKEEKRILTIRILALLSLHGWGPTGHEDSSLILSQAIHHAQTFGLHLAWPEKTSKSLVALFWCLWSLDRWNCAVNGRPPMINDYDTGQDVADVLPLFQPSFQIWLRIASQLGGVIKSYRPVMDGHCEPDAEIPMFEEIVEDSSGFDVYPDILESLELFHHAVIILFTHAQGLQGRSRSRMTKIRQSQSLFSVAALVRKQVMRDAPPLSIFAYTVSIAFSVTYRQLKEAKLPSAKPLAIDHLDLFHQSLKGLSDTWWLAAVMTNLSKAALDGIHRQRVQPDPNTSDTYGDGTDDGARSQSPSLDNQISVPATAPLPNVGSAWGSQSQGVNADSVVNAEPFPPEVPSPFAGAVLSLDDEAYFDSFFENFPSLNFPSVLGEPFLADQGSSLAF